MPQEHKKSIRNDILFISGILIIAIIGFVIFKFSLKSGNTVKISIDGIDSEYDSVCRVCYKKLKKKIDK